MVDLPLPNINGDNSIEKTEQITRYLLLLKEELEFILSNISQDNLSKDLLKKIESANADIDETKNTQEEQRQQLTKHVLTVGDVLSSKGFKSVLDELEARVKAYTDKKVGEVGGTE